MLKLNFTFFVVILLLSTKQLNGSFINDFLSGAKSFWPRIKDYDIQTGLKKLPVIDFELPSEDDEFLKQGMELIKASTKGALDICSHRVILNLKKNCNQLTSEEVGKLAVMLMNCHLQVENRSQIPCKPEMTLQQCTMGMDKHYYQIYTLMTHRAIGICSALKNEQFRALTEMTVNRLIQATSSQSEAINEALENQHRINQMGIENIREYVENNERIKEGQQKSLEELTKTNEKIEEIQTNIQREIEIQQKSELQMKVIDKTAHEISQHLEQTNRQMIAHYQEALDFLDNFKSTMVLISSFIDSIQNSFDKFQAILNEVGINISAEFFVLLTLNFLYFLSGMVFIIFMNLGDNYKRILIALCSINVLDAYLKLDFPTAGINSLVWISFTTFYQILPIITKTIAKIKIPSINIFKFRKSHQSDNESDDDCDEIQRERSKTPLKSQEKTNTKAAKSPMKSIDEDKEMAEIFSNQLNSTVINSSTPIRSETPLNMQRPLTPAMLRVMNTERSATPWQNQTGRIQCQAITNKGLQCKNAALAGNTRCRVHNY